MSRLEQNQTIIKRYFEEVWNKGNWDTLDEIISLDYINHSPGISNPPKGPKGLKPIVMAMRAAFSDLHYEITNMVLAEDQVAVHTIMRGTHQGDFFGIPATNKSVELSQMQIERIEEGKIIEHWRVTDEITLMKQLGLIVD